MKTPLFLPVIIYREITKKLKMNSQKSAMESQSIKINYMSCLTMIIN